MRIEANVVASKGKGKKKAADDDGAVEGVVYRVRTWTTLRSLPRRFPRHG